MARNPIAVAASGMVTSVGQSAPAACAAIRAKLSNPLATRFIDRSGAWITGHPVESSRKLRGVEKLAWMASLAARECLAASSAHPGELPLLLCVAEEGRPGRFAGLDDTLFLRIEHMLFARFHRESTVIAQGSNGITAALRHAQELVDAGKADQALILGVDSLLVAETIEALLAADRLLLPTNSNGFMPGEAAAAILVGPRAGQARLDCLGIGFGVEPASLGSGEPLRGIGMRQAVRAALFDAGLKADDLDFRVADVSGEQYFFKEGSLALGGLFRLPKDSFDIWHAAESTGEVGAAAGVLAIGVLDAGHRKAYAPGPTALCHFSGVGSRRSAAVFRYGR